ncbi:MAG: hypothetical protein QM761_01375 [Pseudoxanthomonas sp.]
MKRIALPLFPLLLLAACTPQAPTAPAAPSVADQAADDGRKRCATPEEILSNRIPDDARICMGDGPKFCYRVARNDQCEFNGVIKDVRKPFGFVGSCQSATLWFDYVPDGKSGTYRTRMEIHQPGGSLTSDTRGAYVGQPDADGSIVLKPVGVAETESTITAGGQSFRSKSTHGHEDGMIHLQGTLMGGTVQVHGQNDGKCTRVQGSGTIDGRTGRGTGQACDLPVNNDIRLVPSHECDEAPGAMAE